MMNRWSRGWLAGGPQWNWGGCDWFWWAAAGCPGWVVVCPVHEALWPGSHASCLAKLPFQHVVDSYSFPMNCLSLVRSVCWLVYGQRKESCEMKQDWIGDGVTCGCPHNSFLSVRKHFNSVHQKKHKMRDMLSASIIWIHSQKYYLYGWPYSISDELICVTPAKQLVEFLIRAKKSFRLFCGHTRCVVWALSPIV